MPKKQRRKAKRNSSVSVVFTRSEVRVLLSIVDAGIVKFEDFAVHCDEHPEAGKCARLALQGCRLWDKLNNISKGGAA
jgi:hypothetical protein